MNEQEIIEELKISEADLRPCPTGRRWLRRKSTAGHRLPEAGSRFKTIDTYALGEWRIDWLRLGPAWARRLSRCRW